MCFYFNKLVTTRLAWITWPMAPRTTNDTVCQLWVTSHRPTPPAWMTAIPLPQPVQHGWLHLLHHQHEWHQADLAVARGLPVVSVIPTTKFWVATGLGPQHYIFCGRYTIVCQPVTLHHHSSNWSLVPALATGWRGGGRIYTLGFPYFCISQLYFQNTQSLPDCPPTIW